jgi:hypothetical protein
MGSWTVLELGSSEIGRAGGQLRRAGGESARGVEMVMSTLEVHGLTFSHVIRANQSAAIWLGPLASSTALP